jgi:hypothetical protein
VGRKVSTKTERAAKKVMKKKWRWAMTRIITNMMYTMEIISDDLFILIA